MSVEITLGATNAAGLAPQPGEQEVEPVTTTEERAPDQPTAERLGRDHHAARGSRGSAGSGAGSDPQETSREVETTPEQQAPIIETPEQKVEQAPERTRPDAPTEKKAAQKKQVAAVPSQLRKQCRPRPFRCFLQL